FLCPGGRNLVFPARQSADKQLKEWGLRGAVLLLLSVPVGVAVGLLDSFSGFVAGLVLGATGLVLVLIGFTLWMEASSTRKGWEGEQRVAGELSYLNDDFLLLNDVMLWGKRKHRPCSRWTDMGLCN